MKRFLEVFSLFSLLALIASCNKDDGSSAIPPRDYAEQYVVEEAAIEEYLKTHYIASVDDEFNIVIDELPELGDEVSIWDQTEYPLQNKAVTLDGVNFTLYYLRLNEGIGESPTRGDNVRIAYRGMRLNGVEFDYDPFPQNFIGLPSTISGWREIIPLFKSGEYIDIPNNPNPATYENFGAGVMFLPSAYGYYESARVNIPSYSPLVFSFKLYDVEYTDLDSDGVLNINETENGIDVRDYDTDGDGIPNYIDGDDDNDGYSTKLEITVPQTSQVYDFEDIPTCEGGTVKKHLDASCF